MIKNLKKSRKSNYLEEKGLFFLTDIFFNNKIVVVKTTTKRGVYLWIKIGKKLLKSLKK